MLSYSVQKIVFLNMLIYFWWFVCVCVGKNGTFRSGYSFKVMKNVAIDIAQDLVVRGPFIFWVSAEATFGPKERISNIFNLIFFPYWKRKEVRRELPFWF